MRAVLIAILFSLLCGRACAHFTPPVRWTDDARAFTTPQVPATHQVTAGTTLLSSFAFGHDAVSNLRQSVEAVAAGAISVAGRTVLNAYDRTHRLQVETATEPAREESIKGQTLYAFRVKGQTLYAFRGPTPDGRSTTSGGGKHSATSEPIPVKPKEIKKMKN